MKSLALLTLLSSTLKEVQTEFTNWDYKNNGLDWPTLATVAGFNNQCGKSNAFQSPIDLRTMDHSNPWQDKYETDEYEFQQYNQSYANILGPNIQRNKQDTIYINLPETVGGIRKMSNVSSFNSSWAQDKFGSNVIYNATSVTFHSPSEHTINGKRFDLEMELVHLPNMQKIGGVKGAVAHILFDVERGMNITEEEPELIESFFDSLHLEYGADNDLKKTKSYFSYEVYTQYIMEMVSGSNKWVYKGSLTTPPCEGPMFIQVFDRILPVSQTYIDSIRQIQGKSVSQTNPKLDVTGNFRDTQLYNTKQQVTYLRAIEDRETIVTDKVGGLIGLGAIMCLIMCIASAFWYKICPNFEEAVPEAPNLFDQGSEEDEDAPQKQISAGEVELQENVPTTQQAMGDEEIQRSSQQME